MMGSLHRFVIGGAATLVVIATRAASAQPTDSVAAAEQLFNEARALLDAGDFAAACPRFEASYKFDPALGTLLNMATCYERSGQIASAWGRYREVSALATKAGDSERLRISRERAAALEPRLPRLTIEAKPVTGLVITRGTVAIDPAVLGVAIYVDPGDHAISASAPGRVTFTTKVTLGEGEQQAVVVPELAFDATSTQPAPVERPAAIVTTDPGKRRRVIGLALGGAGVAAVATGLGFGLAARSSWNEAFSAGHCDRATLECTTVGQARTETARDRAFVASVVTGTGVALLATGAILYLTAPERASVTIAPTAAGASVTVGGRW